MTGLDAFALGLERLREVTCNISDGRRDLPVCRDITEQAAAAMGFTGSDLGDIVVAVFEACVNAITHGSRGNGKAVSVRIRTYEDRLEAIVKDSGGGFSCPPNLLMPSFTTPRGRGIPLMKTFMDEVHFEDETGCKVTLVKYL